VGSLGDLHPFIALGQALNAHGVNVLIASASRDLGRLLGAGCYLARAQEGAAALAAEDGAARGARIVLDTLEQLGSN
jgi:UDP:flavonoid glycosyltransferase YjiC (YdhE family)